MIYQRHYPPSRQEFTTFKQGKINSYVTNTVDHESMHLNMDSKTMLEDLYEDEIQVLLKK